MAVETCEVGLELVEQWGYGWRIQLGVPGPGPGCAGEARRVGREVDHNRRAAVQTPSIHTPSCPQRAPTLPGRNTVYQSASTARIRQGPNGLKWCSIAER